MRAILPAKGWPPNMPVTMITGSKTARITTVIMPIHIINFLMMSLTTRCTDPAIPAATLPALSIASESPGDLLRCHGPLALSGA
jgi:hypothetical protein